MRKKRANGLVVSFEGAVETLLFSEAAARKEFAKQLEFPQGAAVPEVFRKAVDGKKGMAFCVAPGKKATLLLEVADGAAGGAMFFFGKGSRAQVSLATSFAKSSEFAIGIFLRKGAEAGFCLMQGNGAKADCRLGLAARLGEGAQLKLLTSNLGGHEQRDGILILQDGRESRCEHFEASLADGSQRFWKDSNHLHAAPDTYSRSAFKYAAAGSSQVHVDGKVTIEGGAPGSDTHLLARSLLLSEKSISHVVPQLFVHNADVSAGHGSAMAPLQEEELFYLRSRGIGENGSRLLVLQGFMNEIVGKSGMGNGIAGRIADGLAAKASLLYPRD